LGPNRKTGRTHECSQVLHFFANGQVWPFYYVAICRICIPFSRLHLQSTVPHEQHIFMALSINSNCRNA
jgi:hypothetical protein